MSLCSTFEDLFHDALLCLPPLSARDLVHVCKGKQQDILEIFEGGPKVSHRNRGVWLSRHRDYQGILEAFSCRRESNVTCPGRCRIHVAFRGLRNNEKLQEAHIVFTRWRLRRKQTEAFNVALGHGVDL